MLLKNDVSPAFAYAGAAGENTQNNAKKDAFFTAKAEGGDDGFAVLDGSEKQSKKREKPSNQKNNRNSQNKKRINLKSILIPVAIIIAVILMIVLVIAIFNAPKSGAKIEDTTYFCYVDDEGKYHVVVDGEELKTTFDNEIELFPAANNSFAYILENVEEDERGNSGIKMHVLEGKKLKSADGLVDDYVAFARTNPGIVYKYNNSYGIFKGDNEDIITQEKSAANFIISDDAKTIIYTIASTKKEDLNILYCFQGLIEEEIYEGITPVAVSADGRYIYGTADSSETDNLYYIDLEKKEITPTPITNKTYGTFGAISEINAEGNEIVFYTTLQDKVISFFYQIGDKSPTTLGQGVFTWAMSDATILAPDTFKNNYFTAKKAVASEDEDGEIIEEDTIITYCFKKNGDKAVTELAKGEGKFSPDGKYFYFIEKEDGKTQLARVTLSTSDYEKNTTRFHNKPISFEITQKGDLYILSESGNEKTANLFFCDDTSLNNKQRISNYTDKDSLRICANTIYFTETIENSEGESTTIYMSTDGSGKVKADFAGKDLTEAPYVLMGVGRSGYAYFIDESDVLSLFYTSNGKTFELISDTGAHPELDISADENDTDKDADKDKDKDKNKDKDTDDSDDSVG